MGSIAEALARDTTASETHRVRWWAWPNVLALDAPAVAMLWHICIAHAIGAVATLRTTGTLGLACWMVYAADYLLDSRNPDTGAKTERHLFFGRHSRVACTLLVLCLSAAALLAGELPLRVRVEGTVLVAAVLAYLGFVHVAPARYRALWPRELVTAAVFGLATAIPFWRTSCLAPIGAFVLLCWLNMSLIETWEWRSHMASDAHGPSRSAVWASEHVRMVGLGAVLFAGLSFHPAFLLTVGASVAGLICVGAKARRMEPQVIRVLADAVLCTPLLILLT